MKRLLIGLILLTAFLGIADSTYIARSEAAGAPLICNVSGFSGCNVVAQSAYSHLFGVSLAEYGVAFYALLFVLAAMELVAYRQSLRRLIQGLAGVGLFASIVFELVQIFLIKALCIYCAVSAVFALLIFIFAFFLEPLRRPYSALPPPPALAA